jgi:hydrogenase nickel incorporation protein HypB
VDKWLISLSPFETVHKITEIGMEKDVLKENVRLAENNLRHLKAHGVKAIDVMGSIGSGKTALIMEMGKRLKAKGLRVAAIAGDVTGQDDYRRFKEVDIPAFNLNTGNECHLDAHLVEHALEDMELDAIDVLFIENVGNLVCPADFPLGTDIRVVVISITEGDDMVRKHPTIFLNSDMAVLNKIDLEPHLDVDVEVLENDYSRVTGKELLKTSVKSGDGIDQVLQALGL